MNRLTAVSATLMACTAVLWTGEAFGWASANRWGGGFSHSWGSTSHYNAWGGRDRSTPMAWAPSTPTPGAAARRMPGAGAPSTPTPGWPTLRRVWTGCRAHLRIRGNGLPPAGLRIRRLRLRRLCSLSPAGRGAVLFGRWLLRLCRRGGCHCRCRGWGGGRLGQFGGSLLLGLCRRQRGRLCGRREVTRPCRAVAAQSGYNGYNCGGTWFLPAYGANGVYYSVVPPP